MKRIFVQGMSIKEYIDIAKQGIITGLGNGKPLLDQLPNYANMPLTFASHVSGEYPGIYRDMGIIFTTEDEEVYASPVDTWNFKRDATWIPGYEKFIFKSVEEMIAKYHDISDFKDDFAKHFKSLNPREVYPERAINDAINRHYSDSYDLSKWADERPDTECTEITFRTPLKIKVIAEFYDKNDARTILERLK